MANRDTKTNLTYDPTIGKWIESTYSDYVDTSTTLGNSYEESASTVLNPPNTNSSSKVDSKNKADKEYIETEFNTLTGEMTVTATEKTICIKVNDTVKVVGIGKYLSGLYFVSAIKRTLDASGGYSQTLTLLKNGFGNSIKSVAKSKEQTTRKEEVTPKSPEIKVGDSVKIVGDNAVYSNAHDGVKVPGWVKKKTHTIRKISNDGNRVLLREINSWTYIKFIQKV